MSEVRLMSRSRRPGPDPASARSGRLIVIVLAVLTVASFTPAGVAAHAANGQQQVIRPRLHVQIGHSSQTTFMLPTAAAYSFDGRFVVTGSSDMTSRLWDAATGIELRAFTDGVEAISSVAVSSGARYVATANGLGLLRVWDGWTGAELRQYRSAYEAQFSIDGKRLFVPRRNGVAVVDVASGAVLHMIREARSGLFVTGDGSLLLASDTAGNIRAWDTGTYAQAWVSRVNPGDANFAFSNSGRYAAVVENGTAVKVVELPSGKLAGRFGGHAVNILAVAVSADGSRVLTATDRPEGAIRLFTSSAASATWKLDYGYEIFGLTLAPGEAEFLALQRTGEFALRRVEDGSVSRLYEGLVDTAWPAVFSATGSHIVGFGVDAIAFWDLETGSVVRRIARRGEELLPEAPLTADGRAALVKSADGQPGLFEPPRGSPLAAAARVSYSNDLSLAVSESEEPGATELIVWDVASGTERGRIPGSASVIAGDGSTIAVEDRGRIVLRDASTLAELQSFPGDGDLVALGSGGSLVVLQTETALSLVDASSGRLVHRLPYRRTDLTRVRFSPAGDRVLAAGTAGVTVWSTATGKEAYRISTETHYGTVDASFSPDGRFVLTGGAGPARLWDAGSGREVGTLVAFRDGDWAVVEPGGRFDTNALDGTRGLSWFVGDNPLAPLPIEIFMRDMYEPRLLARLLAGEALPPVRDLTAMNRVQPVVEIVDATQVAGNGDRLRVRVRVTAPSCLAASGAETTRRTTSVHDVRLFRDGQLVGVAPEGGGSVPLDPQTGSAIVEFADIRIPRRSGKRTVELTAHAFNDDRVKSSTARRTYEAPPSALTVRGRAYVIGIGVNDYGARGVDLRFAVNDARQVARLASGGLDATRAFDDVIGVELVAEHGAPSTASKASIRAVLDRLAGREEDPVAIAAVPGADRIRPAEPEDVVIVSFSGHGFADPGGSFFLAPSDALEQRESSGGEDAGSQRRLEHEASDPASRLRERCVSSDELAEWLRDVDAGDILLVVDACQSAASVESEGFKPGPMGSRGLGQLAYDKGMRILAATQADNVAIEGRGLEHGLLSYALVIEGLGSKLADFRPADGRIDVAEWLRYGVNRVPALAAPDGGARLLVHGSPAPTVAPVGPSTPGAAVIRRIQRPSLFDFARSRRPLTIMTHPADAPVP